MRIVPVVWVWCSLAVSLWSADPLEPLAKQFSEPPLQYRSWPLYWLNAPLDPDALREQIHAMRDECGFGGFAPLTLRSARPEYLTDGFFERYGLMLELAEQLGLKVIFYDDINFPTGTAGGRLAEQYPDSMLKNLRKVEDELTGPATVRQSIPDGTLMAAVAMNTDTRRRIDLAEFIHEGTLCWDVPPGTWKVMLFVCVVEGQFVDYLDAAAVQRWMSLTYDQFARRFGKYFGTTIVQSFFDDTAMVYTSGGRTWTPSFNRVFREKHDQDPALLYPALWYDIGPDTEAARVALFGLRAELMAEGFVRTIQQWCAAHGIQVSGHPAGNYNPQPVEVSGDNIKFYKYCDIPLLDSIHYYTHGRDGFKLPISAAFNYDRPITAVEIYGNYPDSSVDAAMLFRSAMELFVRGANLMIPHGMWYEPHTMHIPPEISHRNGRFAAVLPDYNRFVGRCSLLLQGGRHVADIGVVYPVTALQAAYQFDVPGIQQPNWGYDAPAWADYLRISDRLTGSVRRDFTFLHPEIIDERCTVERSLLRLNNAVNWEEYPVIIIPGGEVISWSNLQKIQRFYEHGGRVIATTQLPFKSSEFGHDQDVQHTIAAMFGQSPQRHVTASSDAPYRIRIELSGSTIKTYVKDVLVDVTVDDSFGQGHVGFRVTGGEQACLSQLRITTADGNVLFEDDFLGGLDGWVHTGNATIRDGWLVVTDNHTMRTRDGAAWTDYTIEAVLSTDKVPTGLTFRAAEDAMNRYMWQFWPDKNRLRPHKQVNGQWWVLKDIDCVDVDESLQPFYRQEHPNGGRAYFTHKPTIATLHAMLHDALPIADVSFEGSPQVEAGGGMLSYLHKVKDNAHVFYFANSSDERVETWVRLRGRHALQKWDPHTGTMCEAECEYLIVDDQVITRTSLTLDPVKSVFLIAPTNEDDRGARDN